MQIEFTRDEPFGCIEARVIFDEETTSILYRTWENPQWWLMIGDDIEVSIERGTPLALALDAALAEEAVSWGPAL
jgi:hypothetical protein